MSLVAGAILGKWFYPLAMRIIEEMVQVNCLYRRMKRFSIQASFTQKSLFARITLVWLGCDGCLVDNTLLGRIPYPIPAERWPRHFLPTTTPGRTRTRREMRMRLWLPTWLIDWLIVMHTAFDEWRDWLEDLPTRWLGLLCRARDPFLVAAWKHACMQRKTVLRRGNKPLWFDSIAFLCPWHHGTCIPHFTDTRCLFVRVDREERCSVVAFAKICIVYIARTRRKGRWPCSNMYACMHDYQTAGWLSQVPASLRKVSLLAFASSWLKANARICLHLIPPNRLCSRFEVSYLFRIVAGWIGDHAA